LLEYARNATFLTKLRIKIESKQRSSHTQAEKNNKVSNDYQHKCKERKKSSDDGTEDEHNFFNSQFEHRDRNKIRNTSHDRENHPSHTKISATPQKLTCEHRIVLVENCTRRNRLVQTLGSHTRVESTVCKMVRRRETQRLFQLP